MTFSQQGVLVFHNLVKGNLENTVTMLLLNRNFFLLQRFFLGKELKKNSQIQGG